VANNRRRQRRQGVVYGPPRQREQPRESGVVIGRFLGLGVLLLTFGLLAAGALAFMGDQKAPAQTPVRTRLAQASATPDANATSFPLETPVASTPTVTSTPIVPPTIPTPVPPVVHVGPGFVTFGTRADATLHVLDPRATFAGDERITWSAFLTARADSNELRLKIYKLDPAAVGGEALISDAEVTPLVRNAQIFQHRLRPDAALQGPGIYVVRYVRGIELMSEGYFQVSD
jgi:hypothetical protein